MEKLRVVLSTGLIGALTGAVIAEFFPGLFRTGVTEAIGMALNDVFSPYRNELALRYGIAGLVIGIVVGIIIILASGTRTRA